MVAPNKIEAEAAPEEQKLITGWLFDTRRLLVKLPANKFIAWTRQINEFITKEQASLPELECLIGRLNHAAAILPMARHFMGRLRSLEQKCHKFSTIKIPSAAQKDLQLWKKFLSKAHEGTSMNLLSFRMPTHAYQSDACEHGLGGYSNDGIAWQWSIPPNLLGRAHIISSSSSQN